MRFLVVLLPLTMCAPAAQPEARPEARQEAQPSAQSTATSAATTVRRGLVEALDVLHEWDTARARAWAEGEPGALRSLYVRGSGAGRADLRLLRDYRARGLVVRRLATQVFAVRVLHRDPSSLRLRVFDRVAGGEVVGNGDVAPLRSSRPVTRTITFRLDSGAWRVGAVNDSGRAPRGARPSRLGR
jgi:hypothetical protein